MAGSGRPDILVLDGATGTELGRRGADIALPLWSARALIDAPDVVEQIHVDYLNAGADAITTNTFRTHRRSLAKAEIGDHARELTRQAVDIAKAARDRVGREALILGSVAPLEDCYEPQLAPDDASCRTEHEEMITTLLDAGVDRILIETINTDHEALAAAKVAQELAPGKWMISLCVKTQGPPGMLLRGTTMIDLLPALTGAWSVGVNCIAAHNVVPQVELLRRLLPETTRVSAYANVGHQLFTGHWVNSDAVDPDRYAEYALSWIDAGATVIGGCCGTTPDTVRAIASALGREVPG